MTPLARVIQLTKMQNEALQAEKRRQVSGMQLGQQASSGRGCEDSSEQWRIRASFQNICMDQGLGNRKEVGNTGSMGPAILWAPGCCTKRWHHGEVGNTGSMGPAILWAPGCCSKG